VCVAGLTPCASGCVDVMEDAQNCGACGTACTAGQVCSAGVCTTACGEGLLACAASCASVVDSVQHCGGCDSACAAGQVCQASACVCTQGRTECAGECTNLAEDPLNCGQCGVVCAMGSTCSAGSCDAVAGSGGAGSGGAGPGIGGTPGSGGQSGSGGAPLGTGGVSTGGQASGGAPSSSGGSDSGDGGSQGSGGAGGCNRTGFYVENAKLFDANCNEFVMRGVNYPYAWYSDRDTQAHFSAIAAAGANVVRIVLSAGRWQPTTTAANVSSLIEWAKNAKLIAMLEVHDTTGYGDPGAEAAITIGAATSFWTNSAMVAALQGQEAYAMVNIGNEPNGNESTGDWLPTHVAAVGALRAAGLEHTIVIDGPNWGQDHSSTMRDGQGNDIWDADPEKNLVFSVHMYQVYEMGSVVTAYLNAFLSNYEAPLIVGEFAADHADQGGVDEATIMSTCEMLGVGYLGWSWSGNSPELVSLDMTNDFNASSLTSWGEIIINGPNGLGETGEFASVFQ